MMDMNKMVAATLAAAKAAAAGHHTHEEYIREYEEFLVALQEREKRQGSAWVKGMTDVLREENQR